MLFYLHYRLLNDLSSFFPRFLTYMYFSFPFSKSRILSFVTCDKFDLQGFKNKFELTRRLVCVFFPFLPFFTTLICNSNSYQMFGFDSMSGGAFVPESDVSPSLLLRKEIGQHLSLPHLKSSKTW